jgi:hypothetical protein
MDRVACLVDEVADAAACCHLVLPLGMILTAEAARGQSAAEPVLTVGVSSGQRIAAQGFEAPTRVPRSLCA